MFKDIVWFATIRPDAQGNVVTLLNAATMNASRTQVLIRSFGSVAPCSVIPSGTLEESQWLVPSAEEAPIAAI
jgi:hypothetical protein